MSDQPEALRLAGVLSRCLKHLEDEDDVVLVARWFVEDSIAELRRLHAVEVERDALKTQRQLLTDEQLAALYRYKTTRDALRDLYNELLFSVGNKYPNETRHQTALRYIKQAETTAYDAAREVKP